MNNAAYKLPYTNIISLGELTYNPSFQLLSSDDRNIALRFKINQVLHILATRQHQVVSREELIDKIWNGNHYIGERALTHTICKLRRAFDTLGENKIRIITIPKAGYCLL
jgi:DNA-binding winged helix-turn-helix (wHTH) protein